MRSDQIQMLRAIHMRPGLSARTHGFHLAEITSINSYLKQVSFRHEPLELNQSGLALLKSIDADRFGNPKWDNSVFLGMISRPSLHE